MDTATTRPRNSPPAPPPKPKSKSPYNNGSDHQQTSYDEHVNNNVENFYENNHTTNNNNNINNNHQHYYSSLPPSDEQVVMTPKGKTPNSTVILIERKLVEEVSDRVHVAGGDHQGIIINKDVVKGKKSKLKSFDKIVLHFSNFSRSKVSKSRATFNARVPRVSRQRQNRTTHTRVANDSLLVQRLVERW